MSQPPLSVARSKWKPLHLLLARLALLNLCRMAAAIEASDEIASVELFTNEAYVVQHATVHGQFVYVGATNTLLQARIDDLSLFRTVSTGPVLDSPHCSANGRDCIEPVNVQAELQTNRQPGESRSSSDGSKERRGALTDVDVENDHRRMTDNFNQVLLAHRSADALIVCGSTRQGVCQLRGLADVAADLPHLSAERPSVPVAANSANASTVAFIGAQRDDRHLLFVAATFTFEPYRDSVPAVCTRSLASTDLFRLVDEGDVSGQSGLQIQAAIRRRFRVHYVAGFSANSFAYWAAVQPKIVEEDGLDHVPYASKLLRVCETDWRYNSYSELPLECLGPDNTNYNLITAVHVTTLGEELAGAQGGTVNDRKFLVAAFGRGPHPDKAQPAASAVCLYPMQQVEQYFWNNIQRCQYGLGRWNLPHFNFDRQCYNMTSYLSDSSSDDPPSTGAACHFGRVGGTIALAKFAVLTTSDAAVTAVVARHIGPHSVAYLATNDGRILKVLLSSDRAARTLVTLQVHPGRLPIGQDLLLVEDGAALLATAGNKLFKVPTASCSSHSTCSACVQSGDPHCGWCVPLASCVPTDKSGTVCGPAGAFVPAPVTTPVDENAIEVDVDHQLCPRPTAPGVQPDNASLLQKPGTVVTLHVANVPAPGSIGVSYLCTFGASERRTPATYSREGVVTCALPPYADRPTVPHNNDHVIVPLRLHTNTSERPFFETKFTFYDCTARQLCTGCVGEHSAGDRWPCHWCSLDNRCVHDAALCSNNTSTASSDQCARIDVATLKRSGGIVIADGQRTKIPLPVININHLLNQEPQSTLSSLTCVLSTGGQPGEQFKSPAHVSADLTQVVCDERTYTLRDMADNATGLDTTVRGELHLMAGGRRLVDTTAVTLYRCSSLARDCSRCVTLPSAYACAWCAGGCRFEPFCPFDARVVKPTDGAGVAAADDACPAPVIDSISPSAGPIDGGTVVTITGRDLGASVDELHKKVFVAGVPCSVVRYDTSLKIACITGASVGVLRGPVKVSLSADREAVSTQRFSYVNPTVSSVWPQHGPASGGTKLTIAGAHLHAKDRSVVKVWLGASIACTVVKADETSGHKIDENKIECLTGEAPVAPYTADQLVVQLDGANRTLRDYRFNYVPDPQIHSVEPSVVLQSGGTKLLVLGTGLNATLAPRIFLVDPVATRMRHSELAGTVDNEGSDWWPVRASGLGECRPVNATHMWCDSPPMHDAGQDGLQHGRHKRRQMHGRELVEPTVHSVLSRYAPWPVGFAMDGVTGVRNLAGRVSLVVAPDPYFEPFPGTQRRKVYDVYKKPPQPLVLQGENLALAATRQDVNVTIGRHVCNVTVLTMSQLVCTPVVDPSDTGRDDSPLQAVRVRVGNVLAQPGVVLNEATAAAMADDGITSRRFSGEYTATQIVVFALAFGCLILLLVALVAVAVWWRRKSAQAEKDYTRIRLQMDNLETSVRQECKRAFAELQTDMYDVADDMRSAGVPYHARRVFAAKVLFKEHEMQHMLLDASNTMACNGDSNGYAPSAHAALAQFEALLWNRTFVCALVDALESQRSFSAADRVHVGSLLTACLARNMQYCSDVVMTLLAQLIDRSARSRQPHMMLRRTESVVEKMLANWLALCLWDELRAPGGPGSSLYLLCTALRHQIDKGPVDAVTGEAKYSLSVDRLLKEQVDAEVVTVLASVSNCTATGTTDSAALDPVPVRLLSCDTVGQAKAKIVDALYRSVPYSCRPLVHDVDLEWRDAASGRGLLLSDDERPCTSASPPPNACGTNKVATGARRLNTLGAYGLPPNDAQLVLLPRRAIMHYSSYRASAVGCSSVHSSSTQLIYAGSQSSPTGENSERLSGGASGSGNYWHLVRPASAADSTACPCAGGSSEASSCSPRSCAATATLGGGRRSRTALIHHSNGWSRPTHPVCYGNATMLHQSTGYRPGSTDCATLPKHIPELYLTRLLTCKGTVQKYIDDFFESVLDVRAEGFPPVIKYLFDFFDREAARYQLPDADAVATSWKNNALPLRLWVNLIKNPDFVLDIERTSNVDACLTVVAQAFMDSFSSTESRLGKDSPCNKLLFARDLPRYRRLAADYYSKVSAVGAVSEQALSAHLARASAAYAHEFSAAGPLRHLLQYVLKYWEPVCAALRNDAQGQRHRLADRLDNVLRMVQSQPPEKHQQAIYACPPSPEPESIYAVVA